MTSRSFDLTNFCLDFLNVDFPIVMNSKLRYGPQDFMQKIVCLLIKRLIIIFYWVNTHAGFTANHHRYLYYMPQSARLGSTRELARLIPHS